MIELILNPNGNNNYDHELHGGILFTGPKLSKGLNLSPSFSGYFKGYRDDISPSIANEFAGGAFRFGHSMIQVGYLIIITPYNRFLYL